MDAHPADDGGTFAAGAGRTRAVVVTYKPDVLLLQELVLALWRQVAGGVIVNNGRDLPIPDEWFLARGFTVHHLNLNSGVATAQNIGFRMCIEQGAESVLLLDQDSVPAGDMVKNLRSAYVELSGKGIKVGAVGPQLIDVRTNKPTPILASDSSFGKRTFLHKGQYVRAAHLISSGCLIPCEVWSSIGSFRDDFFIDYVDIEWCLRVNASGHQLFAVADAKLNHRLGDRVMQVAERSFPIHNVDRSYYAFRNGAYLMTVSGIPFEWKAGNLFHLMKKLLAILLTCRPLGRHLLAVIRGLRHGFARRLGPLQLPI